MTTAATTSNDKALHRPALDDGQSGGVIEGVDSVTAGFGDGATDSVGGIARGKSGTLPPISAQP
jgi:hypothetical protein